MDVWVFAAAAGAGYVAQQLKNLNRGKCSSCDLSWKNQGLDLSAATLKVRESLGQELCSQREGVCDDAYASEAASTSGCEGENLAMLDDFMNRDVLYDSNSSVGLLDDEDNRGDGADRVPSNSDKAVTSDLMLQPSSRDVEFCCGFRCYTSNPRCRGIKSKIMKPQTSLESCLMAQLYNEHAKFEEYICSQKPILRPFTVTDGNRRISRAPHESCSKPSGRIKCDKCNKTSPEENESVISIPRLPNVVPTKLLKRAEAEAGTEQVSTGRNNAKLVEGNQNNAQGGSSDGAQQFYFGLTVGIIYSFLGSKWEIEKLRKSLAQTENLVQDLQEELDMKDALTVKELAVEDHELPDIQNDSCIGDAKQDACSRKCNKERGNHNANEESLRKIEAELEAELDMLESNMNSSRFKGQMSNLAKLDPNFVSDVIEGELRADLFGVNVGTQAYADRDGSNHSTPRYTQYPVSPRQLSLRLHEVIQSRLEQRVRELEAALQHSHAKLKYLESHRPHSPKNYKIGPSSNPDSPGTQDTSHSTDQPVIISLSGETPAPYNDTYEDEEDSNNTQELFHRYRQDPDVDQNSSLNGHTGQHSTSNGSREMAMNLLQEVGNDGLFSSRDDEESVVDDDDEMEKLLIRQIVEKARQGSPALLKAQRALLSTDFRIYSE